MRYMTLFRANGQWYATMISPHNEIVQVPTGRPASEPGHTVAAMIRMMAPTVPMRVVVVH